MVKIKAGSLVEVIVSSIIIAVLISFSTLIILNLFKNAIQSKDLFELSSSSESRYKSRVQNDNSISGSESVLKLIEEDSINYKTPNYVFLP